LKGQAWYHRWFGADYLQLYQHRSGSEAAATIAWLVAELKLAPAAKVLDLACGNGRHSRELIRLGFQTYGFDLSWPLLIEASGLADMDRLERVRGDMRYLPFASGCFSLVLSLFTSFGYFSSEDGDVKVLQEVARVLRNGGIYVLDFLNATLVQDYLVPTEETQLGDKKVTIFRWLDEPRSRVEKRILIHEARGVVREYRESVRLYSEEELRNLLETASITVRTTYGDYNGSAHSGNSPRLILIGYKDA